MFGYVLKRIVFIIPTLAMVMIIAFFISKSVKNDPAESLLSLEGIAIDSPKAPAEYKKNYLKLHLDKPSFYFSVLPSFYPDNLNDIISSTQRNQVKSLLQQKLPYSEVIPYLASRDSLISYTDIMAKDTSEYRLNEDEIRVISVLKYETEISAIESILRQLNKNAVLKDDRHFKKVVNAFEMMTIAKNNFFLPKIVLHGLDNQFQLWVSGIFKGNFGLSIKDGRPVSSKISSALKWTLLLLILNIIFACLVAIPSGIYSGIKPGETYDKISSFVWMMFYSVPVFWMASMCIIYFTSSEYGAWTNIFPSPSTWILDPNQSFLSQVALQSKQLILPVICLVLNDIAFLGRLTRNNVIEFKKKLFSTVAKAKGLSDRQVIIKHVFPNAFLPIITIIAGSIPAGLSGSLIIEVIFNIPGMGRLMYESIQSADWNVVFGILVLISICTIAFLLIADLLYAWLNPKIKLN